MIRATVAQPDDSELLALAEKINGGVNVDDPAEKSERAFWAVRAAKTFIHRRDQGKAPDGGGQIPEWIAPGYKQFFAPAGAASNKVRQFDTGATRDSDDGKIDFDGFLSPLVLRRYAEYMHGHRKLPDGSLRASDNWQLGIDREVYMKSLWRHFFAVWEECKGIETPDGLVTNLCAVLFNASGMLHEALKAQGSEPSAGYAFPLADREGD